MEKLTGLNKADVTEISKQIADAFYDYKYNEDDLGLVVFPYEEFYQGLFCRRQYD